MVPTQAKPGCLIKEIEFGEGWESLQPVLPAQEKLLHFTGLGEKRPWQ